MKKKVNKIEEKYTDHYLRLFIFASLLLLIFLVPITQPYFLRIHDVSELPKVTLIRILGGLALLLIGLWLILGKREFILPPKSVSIWIFLFLISWILSTIFSTNFYLSFFGSYMRQMGFLSYFFYFVIFFLIYDVVDSQKEQNYFFWAIIFSTVIVTFVGILQIYRLMPWFERVRTESRIISTLGHADFLGHFLVMVIPIILSKIYTSEKYYSKILYLLIFLSSFLVLLGSYTRGSWIAFIISLVFYYGYMFLRNRNFIKKNSIITILLIVGMIFTVGVFYFTEQEYYIKRQNLGVFSLKERFQSIGVGLGVTQSNPRVLTWRDSINLFTDKILKSPRLLIGLGHETFSFNFTPYKSLDLARYDRGKGYPDREHNEFLDILFPLGIFGLLSFCMILINTFRNGIYMIDKIPNSERILYLGVISGWIGFIIQSLVLFGLSATYLYFWSLTAFILLSYKFYDSDKVWKIDVRNLPHMLKSILFIMFTFISLFSIYISARFFRAEVFYRFGLDYSVSGDAGKASALFEEAIRLRPQESAFREAAVKAYLNIMGATTNENDKNYAFNRGLYHIEGMLKNAYYRSLTYNLVGAFYAQSYHYLGEKDKSLLYKAEESLYKALSYDKYSIPPMENLMRLYSFDLKDQNKVLEIAKRILEIDPNHEEALNYMAQYYYTKRKYEEAKNIYENLLSKKPDSKDLYVNLGLIYYQLKNYKKAEELLLKALSYDPYDDKVLALLKKVYEAWGIKKSLPQIKLNDNVLVQRGLDYYNNKNYQKAIEFFKKALEANPNSFEAMNNIGACYYMLGDYDNAEYWFSKAINAKIDYIQAYSNLAYVLIQKGKIDMAEKIIKDGLKYKPNDESLKSLLDEVVKLKGKGSN
uniref:Tetratricopeptide repeat protein n=1 Tax=Dictyoglomus thermophilum TaxID=14 RepID=A0A7C3RM19_DICTH